MLVQMNRNGLNARMVSKEKDILSKTGLEYPALEEGNEQKSSQTHLVCLSLQD